MKVFQLCSWRAFPNTLLFFPSALLVSTVGSLSIATQSETRVGQNPDTLSENLTVGFSLQTCGFKKKNAIICYSYLISLLVTGPYVAQADLGLNT